MPVTGSWWLLFLQSSFLSLLPFLLHCNPSLAYVLKNCIAEPADNATAAAINCAHRKLTAVPDDLPPNAASLDLSSNLIAQISRDDFSHLLALRSLNIENNHISLVDDGLFADLGGLKQLQMGSNDITNLTDNVFEGLALLEVLSLEKNDMSYVSPLTFKPLVSLVTVDLSYNNLQLTADVAPLFQLPNLLEIVLDWNPLTSFHTDDLSLNKSNLMSLQIMMNDLTKFSITKDIFPRLQAIYLTTRSGFEWDVPDRAFLGGVTTLSLYGLELSCEVYRVMLQSVASVQELTLSYMQEFDVCLLDSACQVPTLRRLDLSTNSFVGVNETLLQSCGQLAELDLSYNVLEELHERSLASMRQLRFLDMRNNSLSDVPSAISSVPTLEILYLSSNFIGRLVCSDFRGLRRLTELHLDYNRISTLRGCVFRDLNSLRVLNIVENQVHLFVDMFQKDLPHLEVFNMHKNNMKQFREGDLTNLSSLSYLDLEADTFYVLHKGALEGLDNLKTLIITPFLATSVVFPRLESLENLKLHLTTRYESNGYKDPVPHFSNLNSLRNLLIQSYHGHYAISPDLLLGLKSLRSFAAEKFFTESPHSDTFKYTPDLRSLRIVQSNLLDLKPDLLRPVPKLRALDLSQNKLRSLEFLAQAPLPALTTLILSRNELTTINHTVFLSLPALAYLDLRGNSFTCDCDNVGFIQWVKNNNRTQVVNGHQYICAFPLSKKGHKLLDFDIQSCWVAVAFLCFLATTSLVLLTLLTSFTYHFLRWQLVYAYYLLLAFLYDGRKGRKKDPHCYDAFVSYNVQDEAWVYREMLPVLEGEQGWRLCLHHRDFQPGKPIVENITDAIYSSRKTICVISWHYLESEWCSREIQMASFRLFDERKDVLILLFLEEIPAAQLSPYHRIRRLVRGRSYLSWPRAAQHAAVFWHGVRRALETADAPGQDTAAAATALCQPSS